jgi:hypothetical protein
MPRAAAALVAIVCWAALAIQFSATFAQSHNVLATLWTLVRYFTIVTNLALSIALTAVAVGRRVSPTTLGALTLAILLVGAVYVMLLRGLHQLTGPALVADYLLHYTTPALMLLYWLLFVPRGRLKWSAPWLWTLFPVTYFVYALGRGEIDHRYPYPFIDLGKLGWVQVALNGGGIALAFILAGFLLVWIDSWRPLGPSRGKR